MKAIRLMKPSVLLFLILALFVTTASAAESMAQQLQRGLFEEEGNRDLTAAIKAYQSMLAQFDDQRHFASTAVFRLGECYRKQGKHAEAANYYLRILRDFSDQSNLVNLATIHLKASGNLPATQFAESSPPPTSAIADQKRIVELRQLFDLETQIEQIELLHKQNLLYSIGTLVNDSALMSLGKDTQQIQDLYQSQKKLYTADHPTIKAYQKRLTEIKERTDAHVRELIAGLNIRKSILVKRIGKHSKLDSFQALPPVSGFQPATKEEAEELARIVKLVNDSPDMINRSKGKDGPALHRSAKAGHLAAASFLLENGADIDSVWSSPSASGTPLQLAVNAGQKRLAEFLIEKGANINAVNNRSETPLITAIKAKFEQLTHLLLSKGAKIPMADENGVTPLHYAAILNQEELVEKLLKAGADANAKTHIKRIVLSGRESPIHVLDSNLGVQSEASVLYVAAMMGHDKVLKILLKAGADPNALTVAGDSPLLKVLQAYPNIKDKKSILASIKALIDAGAELNVILKPNP